MMDKTAYCFDPETGEYTGRAAARASPLEPGKYLLPVNAAFVEPPRPKIGEAVVRSGKDWLVKRDRRGREYWLTDGSHHVISAIGEIKPEEALDAPPPASELELAAGATGRFVGGVRLDAAGRRRSRRRRKERLGGLPPIIARGAATSGFPAIDRLAEKPGSRKTMIQK